MNRLLEVLVLLFAVSSLCGQVLHYSGFNKHTSQRRIEVNEKDIYPIYFSTPDLIFVGDEKSLRSWRDFYKQIIMPVKGSGMLGLVRTNLNKWSEIIQFPLSNKLYKGRNYTLVLYYAQDVRSTLLPEDFRFIFHKKKLIERRVLKDEMDAFILNLSNRTGPLREWNRLEWKFTASSDLNFLTIGDFSSFRESEGRSYMVVDEIFVIEGSEIPANLPKPQTNLQEDINKDTIIIDTVVHFVLFESGSWDLDKKNKGLLNNIFNNAENHHTERIILEGSTDYKGKLSDNMHLATRRCESVCNFLFSKGISKGNIEILVLGEGLENASIIEMSQDRSVKIKRIISR